MLIIRDKFITTKFFAKKIAFIDLFKLTRYEQFIGKNFKIKFMKKFPFYTKYVYLDKSCDEIKKGFSKNVKYEINRAKRDGIECKIYDLNSEKNKDFYIKFYNEFAKSKGINIKLKKKYHIDRFKENLIVTYASFNEVILVMHGYILDHENKIVVLAHSSSIFRSLDSKSVINKNFVGRANRYLHFWDMCYFKKKGFIIYDLGGYKLNTNNEILLNINKFKDGFKGELVEKSHYESWSLVLVKEIKRFFEKWKK
jgi:hypothetical protein